MRVPTEQYFPVVLFITLYMQGGSRILGFDESYWAVISLIELFSYQTWIRWFWLFSLCIKSCRVTIQIKATELYFSARAVYQW